MIFNKLFKIGKLKTIIVILPAKEIASAIAELPAFEQSDDENSAIYPIPIIFNTLANSWLFIPVLSTKVVMVEIMVVSPSIHIETTIHEPINDIKIAISGFTGLTTK